MNSKEFLDPLFLGFALDRVNEAVTLIDKNAKFCYTNQKASEILNYSTNDPTPLFVYEIDANYPLEIWQAHWKELEKTKKLIFETIIHPKNKQPIPIEISASFYVYKDTEYELVIFRDISERKEAIARLKAANDYHRGLIETTLDPLAVVNTQGIITDVNLAMEKITGLSRTELIGNHITNFFDNKDYVVKVFSTILSTGLLKSELAKIKNKDGTSTSLILNANTIQDETGLTTGVFVAFKDISERLKIESELEQQNERYRNAQIIGHVGNWEYNVQTGEFWGSDEAKRIYGFDLDDTAFTTEEVETCIPDRVRVHQALIDLIESDKHYELEFEIHPHNGAAPRFIKSIADLERDPSGQPLRVAGVIIDITERKQSEQSLHLLNAAAEAAGNAIVIADKEGNITWANSAFTELTGYEVSRVIGNNPRLLKSGEHDEAFYNEFWSTISSGKRWHGELVNKRADGTLYNEEMTISPVINAAGEIEHYVAVKQNIDARKQQESEREIVLSVTNALRAAMTRTDSINVFLQQLLSYFKAEGTLFVCYDPNTNETRIEQGFGRDGENVVGLHIPLDQGISNQVLRNGIPYFSNDVHSDPNFKWADHLSESKAAACLPLYAHDQIIGAIWVKRVKPYSPSDMELLTTLCSLAADSIQRVTFFEKTQRQYKHMTSIHQVGQAISSILNLKIILDILLRNAVSQLGVDAASILLYDPVSSTLKYSAGVGFITEEIAKSNLKLGEGRAGKAAAERRMISNPDLTQAKDSFSRVVLFQKEELRSHHVAPLIDKGEVLGVLEVFSKNKFFPDEEWLELFGTLATQAAIAIDTLSLYDEVQKRNSQLSFAYDATIKGWSMAMDMRDRYSGDHTQRVVDASQRLAQALGITGLDLISIRRGALLHDVGKISVPDKILQKPGKLSPEERKELERHPVMAYEMLRSIHYLKNAIEIPYCHHEKWDGSGYPRGLKGEEIPISARIFSVVNTWDALTNDRPYRKAMSQDDAIQEMRSESGKAFDPKIVEVFLKNKLYELED